VNAGGGAAVGRGNQGAQPRVTAQPRVDANARQPGSQALQGNRGQTQTRTFSRDGNTRNNIANDVNRGTQAGRGQNREPNLGARFGQTNNRLTVNSVTANSAAAQVGLRGGDQIVSVGGRNVNSQRDFQSSLSNSAGNQNWRNGVPVVVRRNGALQTLYWTNLALGLTGLGYGYGYGPYGYGGLGFYGPYRYGVGYNNGYYNSGSGYYDDGYYDDQMIAQENVPQPDMNAPFLGIVLDTRYATSAVVRDVYSYSPADTAGLQPGDTITRINDQPISAPSDLSGAISQMQPGSKVSLTVTGPNRRTVEAVLSTRAEAQRALEAAKPKLGAGEGEPTAAPRELPAPAEQ
jgi:membrane-associated protease RseP (regulator of RpoE activity)